MNPVSPASSDASSREQEDGASRWHKTDRSAEEAMTPTSAARSQRRTKRFVWSDELHLRFVAAVVELGLKNATPKALLALLEATNPNSGLTTEHVKSHLHRFRLHYERSRLELQKYSESSPHSKHHRRHLQHRINDGCKISAGGFIPERPDTQWSDTNSSLGSTDRDDDVPMAQEGPSERQMHLAMQEQMNFHRQILTRKVQVSRNLSPSENTDSSNVSESTDNRDDNNDPADPADPQQQINPFLRLPPRRPLTEGARALPSSPSTADAEGSVGQGSQSDDEGLDLYRWARFNLNVGMEDDDLFDFLES